MTDRRVLVAVFAVGFAVRLLMVVRSRGGLWGDFGYDPGVYYASADALLHGRMPYADFILLHPPALTLVLTPFALLGTVTSDHLGFMVANVAFQALGGVNAALVFLVARRFGVARAAAAVAAAAYALWPGSVGSEFLVRLEPLGNFLLLAGLLCLAQAARVGAPRWWVLAGAGFGAASATKIWWVVPLVVIVAWTARRRAGWRPALLLAGGAGLSVAAICGPFFAFASGPMWRMVVTDQLGRQAARSSKRVRLEQLTSLRRLLMGTPRYEQLAVLLVVLLLLLVLGVAAWQVAALRSVVLIAAAELVLLLLTPTYFGYYADFLAPALALLVAGAATSPARVGVLHWGRAVAMLAVSAAAVGAVAELTVVAGTVSTPFPGPRLAAAVQRAHVRCVLADSPQALIELNVLSRTLAADCPNRVDVSGSTYDVDRPTGGQSLSRPDNTRWQRDIYRYLTSGNAEITIRQLTGLSPATKHRLEQLPVLARNGRFVIRRIP